MNAELHILTRKDELTDGMDLLEADVFDLTAPEPEYGELLERIFQSEKVHVW